MLRKEYGRKTPPGREVTILRLLPRAALVGSLIPIALSILVRMTAEPGVYRAKQIRTVDIFAIAFEATLLTAVLTVAIGCVVVHIMKGPAYVADTYPVEHSDQPDP